MKMKNFAIGTWGIAFFCAVMAVKAAFSPANIDRQPPTNVGALMYGYNSTAQTGVPLQTDADGNLKVASSGSSTIIVSGGSTAANQVLQLNQAVTIQTNTDRMADVLESVVGSGNESTSPVSMTLQGGKYLTSPAQMSNGQSAAIAIDNRRNTKVTLLGENSLISASVTNSTPLTSDYGLVTRSMSQIMAGGTNSPINGGVGTSDTNGLSNIYLDIRSLLMGVNGVGSASRIRTVDGESNTATALGMLLVGPGYVQYGPVTITATGTSTPMTLTAPTGHAPFDQWTCQCKATGTLTAVTTRFEGSADLANYDATTPLTTENTFTNDGQIFFSESKYVRAIRFNTSLFTIGDGTNFICTGWGKGF